MGNVLAQPVRVPVDPLADLPGVVLKDTLGNRRPYFEILTSVSACGILQDGSSSIETFKGLPC